ncbi:MAG: iron-sulfur cluster repair di-iron protein [Ignavibacteriaceae bacterium]|jgi:regulator of cell morphogenesis and NO signaling|nr:iron-sulfur cluster repair di-iron protein [Ignavibacteriaceae bacterium]
MSELKLKDAKVEDLIEKTLAEIVTNNIRSAIVFEEYGLDFCCKGNRGLKDACADKNIDLQKIVDELIILSHNGNGEENPNDWQLDFLVDYIINNHHQYVRRMIPVITLHADKVASVHGKNHSETIQIADLFLAVREELEMHMMKEERILFPQIKQMVLTQKENSQFFPPSFGTIQNPIRMMEYEHTNAGDALSQIRELSNNYTHPEDACNTFKALFSELKEFEEDLHKHIHLENNILFPKSIILETELLNNQI